MGKKETANLHKITMTTVVTDKKELISELKLLLYNLEGSCISLGDKKQTEAFVKPTGGLRKLEIEKIKVNTGLSEALILLDGLNAIN